jgi:hypothetical protein
VRTRTVWALLLAANFACWGVLGFYETTDAAPRSDAGKPPFANSVEQRFQMIQELQEIKQLLREQNALFRSGGLKVVVAAEPDR